MDEREYAKILEVVIKEKEKRIKELEEEIEKHRNADWKTIEASDYDLDIIKKANKELYKLIEKK